MMIVFLEIQSWHWMEFWNWIHCELDERANLLYSTIPRFSLCFRLQSQYIATVCGFSCLRRTSVRNIVNYRSTTP